MRPWGVAGNEPPFRAPGPGLGPKLRKSISVGPNPPEDTSGVGCGGVKACGG